MTRVSNLAYFARVFVDDESSRSRQVYYDDTLVDLLYLAQQVNERVVRPLG